MIGTNVNTSLADLPVGGKGRIVSIKPNTRGAKKFADVGLIVGAELKVEAHAPMGGLIRVRVLDSSMALHREEAANIIMA